VRPSQSFSDGEILLLDFILRGLTAGKDVGKAAHHKEFGSLASKIMRMRVRLVEYQASLQKPVARPEPSKEVVSPAEAGERAGMDLC
jgi:hypothetical protein